MEPSLRIEGARLDRAVQSFLRGAVVGTGCRITAGALCINQGPQACIHIGDRVICRGLVRRESFHSGSIIIGDDVYLGDDTLLSSADRIEIGRHTMLAHGVHVFDNDSHPIDAVLRERDYLIATGRQSGARPDIAHAQIEIGENVWIGFGSIILKGVRIGDGSVVGAGSVVTSDVPSRTIVAGNPARHVRDIPERPSRD